MTEFNSRYSIFLLSILMFASCSLLQDADSTTDKKMDQNSETEASSENDSTSAEKSTENESEQIDAEEDVSEIELLSEAIRSYDAGRYMISKNFFEKIIQNHPGSPLSITAELKLADCLFFADRFNEAIAMYREFAKLHSKHEARPYTLYMIAESFQKSYQGTKQDLTPLKEAIKQYLLLINEYPRSNYSNQAAKQVELVEEELFKSELAVIEFYERTGDEKSAESRKLELRTRFGHLSSYRKQFGEFMGAGKVPEDNADLKSADKEENIPLTKNLEEVIEIVLPSVTPLLEEPKATETDSATLVPSLEPSILSVTSNASQVPSDVPTISSTASIETPAPTVSNTVPEPMPSSPRSTTLKTLADLESGQSSDIYGSAKTKASINSLADSSTPTATPASQSVHESQIESQSNSNSFLISQSCEQEDGILKIFLKFSAKPFLKSSIMDLIESSTTKKLTSIIFQEGFSTEPLPAESDNEGWIKRSKKICMENANESVVIQEIVKASGDSNQFGPKSYVFVYISSTKISKVSVVNGSSPLALAIVAR